MDKLEEKIGYRFKNRGLLVTALTHSSYANERHSTPCLSALSSLATLFSAM